MPEEYANADISFQKAVKNNDLELEAMVIRNPNQNIMPNIYINSFYDQHEDGRPMESILQDMSERYQKAVKEYPIENLVTDFDKIKDQIVLRVVGKENNHKLMDMAPYREENDLLVTFRWIIKSDEKGLGTVLITNELMEGWSRKQEIDMDELYKLASENTQRMFPVYVTTMEDMLFGLMDGMTELEEFLPVLDQNSLPMYIITNQAKINGATAVLYPGVLDTMAEKLNGNFFILPSSIHEVIVVPDNEMVNIKDLQAMVKEVNAEQVAPDEVLSNSVYWFDSKEHRMTMVNDIEAVNTQDAHYEVAKEKVESYETAQDEEMEQ